MVLNNKKNHLQQTIKEAVAAAAPISEQAALSKTLTLCACSPSDKEFYKTNYYIGFSNATPNHPTNNPIKVIHQLLPSFVEIQVANFKPEFLGLYVNTLVAEGYELFVKLNKSEQKNYIYGNIIYFKLHPDTRLDIKRKLMITKVRRERLARESKRNES